MAERPLLSSVVTAAKDQVSTDLGGEVVILSLESGQYYGLNDVGSRIWELTQEPRSVAAIRDTILGEYEIDAEPCERDLLALLNDLSNAGLIQVEDPANG